MSGKQKAEDVAAAAFTLLVKLGVFTADEVNLSIRNGYDSAFDLLNKKYVEMVENGKIVAEIKD